MTGEEKVVPRWSEIDDKNYEHEYQKILWRGTAKDKEEALCKYIMGVDNDKQ